MTNSKMLDKDKDDSMEVKTTVRLSRGVLKQLKIIAIHDNVTMSDLITRLIVDFVNKRTGKKT